MRWPSRSNEHVMKYLQWACAGVLLCSSAVGRADEPSLQSKIEGAIRSARTSMEIGSPIGVANARRTIGEHVKGRQVADTWTDELDRLEREAAENNIRRANKTARETIGTGKNIEGALYDLRNAKGYLSLLPQDSARIWEKQIHELYLEVYSSYERKELARLKEAIGDGDFNFAEVIATSIHGWANEVGVAPPAGLQREVASAHDAAVEKVRIRIEQDAASGNPRYLEDSFKALTALTGEALPESYTNGRMAKALEVAIGRAIGGLGTSSEGDYGFSNSARVPELRRDLIRRLRKLLPHEEANAIVTKLYQDELARLDAGLIEASKSGATTSLGYFLDNIHALARASGLKDISKDRARKLCNRAKKISNAKWQRH